MTSRPMWAKAGAIVLSITTLIVTVPFPLAETNPAFPLGTILASDRAMIGNSVAPTGTTVFAGDQVTSDERTLIDLNNGSRIEMNKANAILARQGKRLVIRTDHGLLRFNFKKGEEVQINAGDYGFTTVGNSRHIGELGLNRRGQIAMNVTEGTFAALNRATGAQTEVNPSSPLVVAVQSGVGSVSQDDQSLTDRSLSLKPDELSEKCIVVDKEAHPIASNSKDVITIEGSWNRKTGKSAYRVVDCTEEAMIRAGASESAAKNAVTVNVFGSPEAKASHTARNAAIIIGIGAAAVAVPLAMKAGDDEEKSPSSR